MFKRITLIFVVGLLALSAKAQFKIESDTLYAYGFAGTSSSSFVDIHAETRLIGLGVGNEILKWVRSTNQLPDPAWTSAVCDLESCKSDQVDTGSFTCTGGDTGLISFHFYAKNVKASGKMIVRFYRASNPTDYVDVVTFATSWKPVGIEAVEKAVISTKPNPAMNSVTFSNNLITSGKLELYNAMGQLVLTTQYTDQMMLDIKDLAAGVYSVKISDATQASFTKIIKE